LAFPNDELKHVPDHYNLDALKTAQRIGRGFINENWKIETTRGRFFLKRRHPDLRQPKIIHAQHALITYLKPKCFPVPQILPTKSANTLLVLDGEFYEIQTFIDGVPCQTERDDKIVTYPIEKITRIDQRKEHITVLSVFLHL
jgi:Ser/Thr protein kinase RdoA (MazF antagonist)